ncbi:hypothetical protein NDU88_007931 [Pleurodeles waltl]|uniref:Uncharacterized protein n=1 Tax=Pleurodeles waltl TaxID=8319 RepID=A0AAV7U1U9_PLEWA|nr:hypothetical protein NDU88_007931 [Pleurodeles waltl]
MNAPTAPPLDLSNPPGPAALGLREEKQALTRAPRGRGGEHLEPVHRQEGHRTGSRPQGLEPKERGLPLTYPGEERGQSGGMTGRRRRGETESRVLEKRRTEEKTLLDLMYTTRYRVKFHRVPLQGYDIPHKPALHAEHQSLPLTPFQRHLAPRAAQVHGQAPAGPDVQGAGRAVRLLSSGLGPRVTARGRDGAWKA